MIQDTEPSLQIFVYKILSTRGLFRPLSRLLLPSVMLMALINANAIAADKVFTGVFQGQGRACFGKLFLREKTVEWNSSFSVCNSTGYTVLKSDLDGTSPHIAVYLKHKSRTCREAVIALTFDPAFPHFWQAEAYVSRQDYEHRTDEDVKARTLMCSMQKLD